jgi:hypothetical protein
VGTYSWITATAGRTLPGLRSNILYCCSQSSALDTEWMIKQLGLDPVSECDSDSDDGME